MAGKEAMDDGSYPVKDADDLGRAIHAVGRGGASHNAIRKHIMARAKALGLSKEIPDNWNADGSLAEANALNPTCSTCDGTGKNSRGRPCPACSGSGSVETGSDDDPQENEASPLAEFRRAKAEGLRGHTERRDFSVDRVELREAIADGKRSLEFDGYASLTDTPYEVSGFTETISRGAFKRTLGANPDVQLLINHGSGGSGMPIARTGVNMTLNEDAKGLHVLADLDPEDPDVQLLSRKMSGGLLNQMSFAFRATDDEWNDDWTDRNIRSVDIHRGDVSVVTQGASSATNASIRTEDALNALRAVGVDGFIDALDEWRQFTLLPMEDRAGKALSAATTEVLTRILSLLQKVDDATDEAIPAMSELLNVPNPNNQSSHNADGSPKNAGNGDGEPDAPASSTATDGRGIKDLDRRRRNERHRLNQLGRAQ